MTFNRDSKSFKRVEWLLETVFLALAGLYLAYRMSRSTTLHWACPEWFLPMLLRGMEVTALLRLATSKLLRVETLVAVAMAGIYWLVYRSDGYDFLLYLAVMTVGFIDIDYRRIIKTYLLTAGTVYVVAVLAGLLGVITNYVFIKNGLRSSWGIAYPTDLASMGLFLLLMLWVVWRRLPDGGMLVLCGAYMLLAWRIAHSSTGMICGALFIFAVLFHMFESKVVDRRPRLGWMKKGANLFATVAFPVLALVMFGIMLAYARELNVAYRLNTLLTNRLKLSVDAWRLHGVKAFGTPFEQNGGGFSTFPSNNYNFVDSTYPLILLRYGVVLFAALCLAWGWTARKAIRCGDRRLVLVLGIIAVHAFAEHHFIESEFNILVVMPLAAYLPGMNGSTKAKEGEGGEGSKDTEHIRAAVIAIVATALLFAVALYLAAPTALSWMKTVLEVKRLGHGEHSLRLFCLLLGVLCGVGVAAWAVSRILRTAIVRAPWRSCLAAIAALAICVVLGSGACWYADRAIDAATVDRAGMVEADREALEIAVKNATGKVYSGVLPEVYHRSVEGMSYAAFFEDDLARLQGDTTLMGADNEHGVFFNGGCLYVQISEEHALYTGDRAVVEALTEAGYHATGYYSGIRRVDLADAALRNEAVYDSATGLALEAGQSLSNGPYYDLYGGRYVATYDLSLSGEPFSESAYADGASEVACVLSVTAYKGDSVLLEKEVSAEQFDADGRVSVPVPFTIASSRDVAFEVRVTGSRRVNVEDIDFVKTPDYDVHTFYDSRLRPVRVEYYDLEGNPVMQSTGYFASENEYDGWGNVCRMRYFDRENALTLCTSGYAELRRDFNAKRQIIREAYYGTDGQPIALTSRQASDEREYDDAGNVSVYRYYDTAGQPVITTSGYAELRREYDEDHRIIRESYFGVNGEPIPQSAGQYAIENEYDDAGNVSVRRFYGEDGQLVLRTDGYAEVHWQYNGMRQVTREEFYGMDGAPIAISSGQAANEREYDDAGNVIVHRYYGVDGAPVVLTNGYAELRREYNGRRQVVRESYFGTDGAPLAQSAGQYAIENEYDDAGNVSVRRFYGEDGQLALRTDGYAEVHWQYNGMRQVTREEFYDTDGALIAISSGQAANERDYDGAGNVIVYRYYGVDGLPVVLTNGYAELRREYNDRRQVVRESYFGTDGAPLAQSAGQYAIENEYDDAGNVSVRRFYGEDGQLALRKDGYAEVHWQYNGMRQVTREEFYGTDGVPIALGNGQAANEREYDGAGNVIVYRYYGSDWAPVVLTNGYAELRREYNDKRQVVRESYFGTDGMPLAQPEGHCAVAQVYDDAGNIVEQRYYDGDGKPVVTANGYAEVHRAFDDGKRKVRETYYDESGAPMVQAAGHAGIAQEYDDADNLAVRRYLDAKGDVIQRTDGYAEVRWLYDAERGVRNAAFYDLDGNELSSNGLNLMQDGPSDWSRWYTPGMNEINRTFTLASANLGEKAVGDLYTCQIEIEFANVTATDGEVFDFHTHGAVDGKWDIGNVWNLSLIHLEEAPRDGIYQFTATQEITESNVNASKFDLGFRCDYWASGSFRVRSVKVEKGGVATEWTPGE